MGAMAKRSRHTEFKIYFRHFQGQTHIISVKKMQEGRKQGDEVEEGRKEGRKTRPDKLNSLNFKLENWTESMHMRS